MLGRALLIATAGGHLTQLDMLAPRVGIDPERALWVTVATSQSRSLLANRDVVWAPYSSPRDLGGLANHLRLARRTLAGGPFSMALSTGASLAPPFLAAARLHRIPCHYIESATRVDGPSVAGRLVSRIPGVKLYSQYSSWSDARWSYRGSVFDSWATQPRTDGRAIRTALVTVGSARGFPFERMLRAAQRALPPKCETIWQVLDSPAAGLDGRVVDELSSAEFRRAVASVDVVITHAGTGSVLVALEAGVCPVVVPRLAEHAEHVDDHQQQIARMLADRGLAVVRSPEELRLDDLVAASATEAVAVPAPAFELIR